MVDRVELPEAPEKMKARFERDGCYFPLPVLTEAEAAECQAETEAFERAHPDQVGLYDLKANLLFPWIDALIRKPGLTEGLAPLLGPDILCWGVGYRNKPADSKTYVGWHQDTPYIHIGPLLVTCWLALTPATVANGCLRVIPGSHKWSHMRHDEKVDPDSMLTRGHYIAEAFDESGAVPVVLKPGEAAVIHYNIVHSSQPNRTKDRRMGMLIDCMPADSVKTGRREFATLIRGKDRWRNFDPDTPPETHFGVAERENHCRSVEAMTADFYAGSDRTPESLTGKIRNVL